MNQLAKYLHYERLLVDLYESLSRQIFTDHDNHLWETCQSYLMENHSENGAVRSLGRKKCRCFDFV